MTFEVVAHNSHLKARSRMAGSEASNSGGSRFADSAHPFHLSAASAQPQGCIILCMNSKAGAARIVARHSLFAFRAGFPGRGGERPTENDATLAQRAGAQFLRAGTEFKTLCHEIWSDMELAFREARRLPRREQRRPCHCAKWRVVCQAAGAVSRPWPPRPLGPAWPFV